MDFVGHRTEKGPFPLRKVVFTTAAATRDVSGYLEICRELLGYSIERSDLRSADFYGEISQVVVDDVLFAHIRCSDVEFEGRCVHISSAPVGGYFDFHLCLSGFGRLKQKLRVARMAKGRLLCFDPALPFNLTTRGNFELFIIRVPKEHFVGVLNGCESVISTNLIANLEGYGQLTNSFLPEVCRQVQALDTFTAIHLSGACIELLKGAIANLHLVQTTRSRNQLAARAQTFMKEHLDDEDLDVERVSRGIGISKSYLQAIFRECGLSVRSWLREQRLQKCRALLLADRFRDLGGIAAECGFRSQSQMSHCFRKRFNFAPSVYRERYFAAK